ncbi:threonine synthase [Candidatus Kaiserbacteria bacterium]|nr:threonine synthase [Candidatus Kaiserbacteria bacterium]
MDCNSTAPLYGATRFRCPDCGGLYDVCHQFEIQPSEAPYWKIVFDRRCLQDHHDIQSQSGVWRFHELVMPSLSEEHIVTLGEGIMPMWRAGNNLRKWIGGGLDLWLMPEGLAPTGSFKDFGGTVMISVAKASGVTAIGCASTGDTSAMAAAYAAAAGMTCAVVLPRGWVTAVQLAQPIAHGAKVITVPGSFDDCSRIVQELVAAGRMFPANSINPSRIEGHQATVFLAVQFFGWEMPDWFVVPVGNGSNSSSIGKGMRTLRDLGFVHHIGRILGVQSAAANPLAQSWSVASGMNRNPPSTNDFADLWKTAYMPRDKLGDTVATAARIGAPVSYKKVIREITASNGAVLTASEESLIEAVLIAGSDGHFVCPQTGTALSGLRDAVSRGLVQSRERVVVVSTAAGIKFPNVPARRGGASSWNAKTCDTEEVAGLIGI